ncbi:MAG: HypC/HybG/HupF family hydrogenase formation chaperone [Anaerolineales bacterium]
MCLGIPGKITEIYEKNDLPMGKIDFGGILKEACLAYVPEAKVGDYALVHVGFAISLMDEEEAHETLKLIQQMADLGDELGEGET